ncbi:MAG TPA: hypothetical protein DDY86_02555 [Syntrophaceae bacterium]|nr:hypothetical protein [Syntrophaceae bacterium]
MNEMVKIKADLLKDIANMEVSKKVEMIHGFQKAAFDGRVKSFILLQSLESSGEFREIPKYKKSSFWEFIENEFGIREQSYRDARFSLGFHYAAAEKHGIGLIARIGRTCGVRKVPEVVKVIAEVESKLKGSLSHTKALEIVKKFEKPAPIKPKDHTDYKQVVSEIRDSNVQVQREKMTLEQQVKRQIETIHRLTIENAELRRENMRLSEENERLTLLIGEAPTKPKNNPGVEARA